MEFIERSNGDGCSNEYDCGFIKRDLDFDAQNVLDAHRSQLIDNHYDMSALESHTIQFKRRGSSSTTNDCHNNSNQSTNTYNTSDDHPSDDKTKLLQFDCNFESGNIGQVNHFRDNEYDITIRGDTNNSRHSVWFYFRVKGGIAGNRMVCHIHNYSKAKSLYSEGFTPIVRSKTRPIWTRLPEYHVNWFKCNRHRRNCFTFSFIFDRTGDEYFFAYAFPYTYSYLQKFLGDIEAMNLSYCKRELLARSVQQRRLDCLRIEEVDEQTIDINERPVLVISSRVHPGETPSSYVLHGLLEFLLSNHESSVYLRRNTTIFVIPMLNPDGVFIGNYRATSLGFDLNRHWHHPDYSQHPTICTLKYLLRQLDADNRLAFYMDLHAHTNASDGFMYCNESQPTKSQITAMIKQQQQEQKERKEKKDENNESKEQSKSVPVDEYSELTALQRMTDENKMDSHYARNDFTTIFPRLLDLHCNEYLFSKTKFCNNPKKAGSARRAMEAILSDIPVCYTFEVSFWRSKQKKSVFNSNVNGGMAVNNLYTQETYRNLGRCMVQALCDMYKLSKDKRGDFGQYAFKSKKFMKGDMRKRLQKLNKNGNKEKIKEGDGGDGSRKNENGNKINVSIPTVPPL